MKKEYYVSFAFLLAVPFVMVLSNSMLIPVLPDLQRGLDATPFQVGLIITAFSIPAGLVIPFTGFFSDRIGRKIIMAPALFLFGLGGALAGLGPVFVKNAYWFVILGRILQGVGGGGTYQLSMALTADTFQSSERSRALGLLEAANGSGKVAAPIIGSAAGLIAFWAPFFVYPILSWPVAAGVWWLVKEPRHTKDQREVGKYLRDLSKVLKDKGGSLFVNFLAGLLVLFFLFGVLSYMSDILEMEHNIKGFIKGFVIAGPVVIMALTSFGVGSLLQREPKTAKITAAAGLLVLGTALILLAILESPLVLYEIVLLLGLGSGMTLASINLLITSATEKERGAVTALYGSVRFFGAALGPPAFNLILGHPRMLPFLGLGVLAVLAGVLAYFLINEKRLLSKDVQAKSG